MRSTYCGKGRTRQDKYHIFIKSDEGCTQTVCFCLSVPFLIGIDKHLSFLKHMTDKIRDILNIRYIKLHFELELLSDSKLPVYKPFALRGGMGYMLMDKYCMADRDCKNCDFQSECVMRRILYAGFDVQPYFIRDGGSCGYVIECEDYRTDYFAGDELHFQIILFGKTIAYFQQILDAFIDLGKKGLGPNKALFAVRNVTNSRRQAVFKEGTVFRERYEIGTIKDYVNYRSCKQTGRRAVFHTPTVFMVKKKLVTEFEPLIIFRSIVRRLYILNYFEGNYIDTMSIGSKGTENFIDLPTASGQNAWIQKNERYSTNKKERYPMRGIKGYLDFSELTDDQCALLLAGELIHIGKETSFGYGKYTMVENNA